MSYSLVATCLSYMSPSDDLNKWPALSGASGNEHSRMIKENAGDQSMIKRFLSSKRLRAALRPLYLTQRQKFKLTRIFIMGLLLPR